MGCCLIGDIINNPGDQTTAWNRGEEREEVARNGHEHVDRDFQGPSITIDTLLIMIIYHPVMLFLCWSPFLPITYICDIDDRSSTSLLGGS